MYRVNVTKAAIKKIFSAKKGNEGALRQMGSRTMQINIAVNIHQPNSTFNF